MKYTGESSRSRFDELIKFMKQPVVISKIKPDDDAKKSLDIMMASSQTESQTLPLTPLGKHFWKEKNNIKGSEKLLVSDKIDDMEYHILSDQFNIGVKHYMHEHGYEVEYTRVTPEHYVCVDYGRPLMKMGPEVTPGSAKRRLETLSNYDMQNYKWAPDWKVMPKAIEYVRDHLCDSFASIDITDPSITTKLPAFTKTKAGVGFPYGRNSGSVNKQSGKTYDLIAFELAKTLKPEDMAGMPATLGGRDQRSGYEYNADKLAKIKETIDWQTMKTVVIKRKPSKARVIYGFARAENYVAAQFFQPFIGSCVRKGGYWMGLQTPSEFKKGLIDFTNTAVTNKLFICNDDQEGYDFHVTAELLTCAGMVVEPLVKDAFGKKVMGETLRSAANKPIIFRDLSSKVNKIMYKYGAIPSGGYGTNIFGSLCNLLSDCYAKMVYYGIPDYVKMNSPLVALFGAPAASQGDDIISAYRKESDRPDILELKYKHLNIKSHPGKGEFGGFFLNTRAAENETVSPSCRAMSKQLFSENAKHLFNAEGVVATWSRMEQITSNKEFSDQIRGLEPFSSDKLGLIDYRTGLDSTAGSMREALRIEAATHGSPSADRLYDGDPQKSDRFDNGSLKTGGLSTMLAKVKAALSPA